MEFTGKHRLVAHPDHPPRSVRSVEVRVLDGPEFVIRYAVEPATNLLLPNYPLVRRDKLWRSTCFELFAKEAGAAAYREFNFAPANAWNAYSFSDWRKGMRQIGIDQPPNLVDCRIDDRQRILPDRYELDVVIGRDLLAVGPGKASLTAIIEERDGRMSYWALAHPPGEPDFHHPACFTATLPAIAP